MTKIREVMTPGVYLAHPNQTIAEAAKAMAAEDVGSLPVAENDRLIGMITDRDLVVRGIAAGMDGHATVREVMSGHLKYCYDDEDVSEVAQNMAELGIRRLPVVDRDKRLVGMVALSNVAHCGDRASADQMLRSVARPH